MIRTSEVKVYIFKADDCLSREERLLRAAEHYFGADADAAFTVAAAEWERQDLEAKKELLKVEKTSLGKPYFPNFPKLHLSISHSGAYWVCALSQVEVGVDIQEHAIHKNETRQEAAVRFAKMARRFFHPVEAKYVEAESFYRFFGVWAARESYVKYTGQGIDASFSEHCVIPESEECWPGLMVQQQLTPSQAEQLTSQVSVQMTAQRAQHELLERGNALTRPLDGGHWYAQGAWFWETLYEENYTLCVCTGEEIPCGVINCF